MQRFFWAACIAISAFASPAWANEAGCGEEYTSKPGETVHQVASKAFGPGVQRQLFMNVLMYRHGQNGGVLEEGTVITIPCESGGGLELSKDFWSASNYEAAEINVRTAGYDKVFAGSSGGFTPLFHSLFEGLLPEGLLTASFASLGANAIGAYQPFPDDGRAGDVSFPWLRSSCAIVQSSSQALCSDALWSDALFEMTSGVYAPPGGPERLADLGPGGLCISDESRVAAMQSGVFTIEMLGRVSGGSTEVCLANLRANTVAAVVVPDISAAAESRVNRNAPRLQKLDGAVFSDTVHAVVDGRNPNAQRILRRLNEGLAKIRVSGKWYQIVNAELTRVITN